MLSRAKEKIVSILRKISKQRKSKKHKENLVENETSQSPPINNTLPNFKMNCAILKAIYSENDTRAEKRQRFNKSQTRCAFEGLSRGERRKGKAFS